MRTWEEAENELAEFYQDYVRETHPAKEPHGEPLYDIIIENLMLPGLSRPASINLRELLERALANPQEPDLSELKVVLSARLEDGQ